MTGMVDVEIRAAERDEMLDLAERLAELDDEQWNSPSLCAQWRIRDVLAHLTAGAEGAFGVSAIFGGMLRHGFNYNRWVAADGQVRGQQDPAFVLKGLRIAAANLVPVADFVKDDVHIFGAKKRIAGLKLTATDMDWSHGNGPEVTSSGGASDDDGWPLGCTR
jgi:uncharacterized protein (TIGR03083 family)